MSTPFLGEVRMFGGNFAISGWSFCQGQLLQISQNDALFALIGTTYGGDGVNTFGLPDLQSRVPIGTGQGTGLQNYTLGQKGGAETVTLLTGQLPSHNHTASAQPAAGNGNAPAANTVAWAQASGGNSRYTTAGTSGAMNAGAIGAAGGNQAHENMLPFLCVNYIIALEGVFPPRN